MINDFLAPPVYVFSELRSRQRSGGRYMLASDVLPKYLHIDDPVEAVAVHGACARSLLPARTLIGDFGVGKRGGTW